MEVFRYDQNRQTEYVDMFLDLYSDGIPSTKECRETESYFERSKELTSFRGFELRENDETIGISIGFVKPSFDGSELYMDQFCVAADHQRQGKGKFFLEEIEKNLSAESINGIILNTNKITDAPRFFRNKGFYELNDLEVLIKHF